MDGLLDTGDRAGLSTRTQRSGMVGTPILLESRTVSRPRSPDDKGCLRSRHRRFRATLDVQARGAMRFVSRDSVPWQNSPFL